MMQAKIVLISLLGLSTDAISDNVSLHENGKTLYQTLCQVCHSQPTTVTQRLAPPMFSVQNHYHRQHKSATDFINHLSQFITQPSKENSLMPGAVQKFGLMPQLNISLSEAKAVATYLYHNPERAPGHQRQANVSNPVIHQQDTADPLKTSKTHALAAKAELGKNLLTAINQKGTIGALGFCHENAMNLTQQVAEQQGVEIKRVSDKNRNPNNAANQSELTYIQTTKHQLSQGKSPEAKLLRQDNRDTVYIPITTQAMCLQCHGQPDIHMTPQTLNELKRLYPDDQAIGYDLNQLRGIWVISQATTAAAQPANDITNDENN